MRSLAGRLEVVGGLDPFAQFDLKALTTEVFLSAQFCCQRNGWGAAFRNVVIH